jgi:hypothetical protein
MLLIQHSRVSFNGVEVRNSLENESEPVFSCSLWDCSHTRVTSSKRAKIKEQEREGKIKQM